METKNLPEVDQILESMQLDPMHASFDFFGHCELSEEIWRSKYRKGDEQTIQDTFKRVAKAIASNNDEADQTAIVYEHMMSQGLFMPAGRILSGAGSGHRVTLVNCFVNRKIEDCMEDIMAANTDAALTMQQGGGMGTDFSTIRPEGAILRRTGSTASGPLPFMRMWDSMCQTIMSAGSRRGAMMGTMICTHPDILKFIEAKHEAGVLTNFNVSVLITDAFMEAVENDEDWLLHFPEKPADWDEQEDQYQFEDAKGVMQYVYNVIPARELWHKIIESTYMYAEPGVIFIDRVNQMNNLIHEEDIQCTNPCVTGDTEILTEIGYQPIKELVGKNVRVWNGEQFSNVRPFTTGFNKIMQITFSNGRKLKVTPYHGFYLSDGTRVEAKDLQVKDKLLWSAMPFINVGYENIADKVEPYSQGFYAGDGTVNSSSSKVYSPKFSCLERLQGSYGEIRNDRGTLVNWHHGSMLAKDFVPVKTSADQAIDWLAGLLDADGCVEKKNNSYVLTVSSKDAEFLGNVVLMLTRLGCNPRMWNRDDGGIKTVSGIEAEFASTHTLMLNAKDSWNLIQNGLKCNRLDLSVFTEPKGIARVGQRVVAVEYLNEEQETFCFTEPLKHAGVFGGILTANCGEQPLPPYGACNLGAVNLARMIKKPFTEEAEFDWELLALTTSIGMSFLDNVIDVSGYPLEQQKAEQERKRRTGLGISGLADAMIQLGIQYSSMEAVEFASKVMNIVANAAYTSSAYLADLSYPAPVWDSVSRDEMLNRPFIKKLSNETRKAITDHGLRNGVLLTVAPTGTTSIVFGNISSSCEPNFAFEYTRNVRQNDGSFEPHKVVSFIRNFAKHCGVEEDNSIWEDTASLSVSAHLRIQAALQEFVDASISKTINCAPDITYERFEEVYLDAYRMGCKGCTTYRPSDVRGSILSTEDTSPSNAEEVVESDARITLSMEPKERGDLLTGCTYKLKWPTWSSALYMTINEYDDLSPAEIFFNTKDSRHEEWMKALSLMITALFRLDSDPRFIADELKKVASSESGGWAGGKQYPSLISYVGATLEKHFKSSVENLRLSGSNPNIIITDEPGFNDEHAGEKCPECGQYAMHNLGGCLTCADCGYSKCG